MKWRQSVDLEMMPICNIYNSEKREGRGAPKKYGGKVKHLNLDGNHFKIIEKNRYYTIYYSMVYSVSLKRKIKLLQVKYKVGKGEKYNLYYATDLSMEPLKILKHYKGRF
ncbi:MAG: hypothetical protein HRT66_07385 [Flavobacteriaceae bacterium]|nr:hypothetical protein [Flavobacteriaceae bacterium]